jgi:hypothetical protein
MVRGTEITTAIRLSERHAIEYPESDGLPTADNTIQFRWISIIMSGLDALFVRNPNVFVAGNSYERNAKIVRRDCAS